jgi:hypothetical protein
MTRAHVERLAAARDLDALYALQERAYDFGDYDAEEWIARLIEEVIELVSLDYGSRAVYAA